MTRLVLAALGCILLALAALVPSGLLPGNALGRGLDRWNAGDPADALASFLRARPRERADSQRVALAVGTAALASGALSHAPRSSLRVALESWDVDVRSDAAYNLALSLLAAEDPDSTAEAVELLKESLRLEPGRADAAVALVRAGGTEFPSPGGALGSGDPDPAPATRLPNRRLTPRDEEGPPW